ncbi:HtrA2 peptidase [Thermoanaerobacter italicus Ab9]|uniref:HtrA2 peptidase n=1 Tax=Thermoanaerobacter italicus (strain DSM 9252 / Ab9) TaxID=580331 RepID=D3T5S4_THEIA|nr:trypsin-like peptidase domain-containing protein [Thermoanaerobacter italicus]ADD03447.1 HtrA2 peptidase [Thermoanaerobacter italicus Ab9]
MDYEKDFENKIEKNDTEHDMTLPENKLEETSNEERMYQEIIEEQQPYEKFEISMIPSNVKFRNNKKSLGKMVKRFRRRMLAYFIAVALVAALIGGGITGAVMKYYGSQNNASAQVVTRYLPLNTTSSDESGILNLIPNIYKIVSPAVVEIDTSAAYTNGYRTGYVPKGSGSGFIISSDGYIVTNNHVIDGASKITVKLLDGRSADAKLIGKDERTDLAVVKINLSNLPVVELGDSSKLQPGELAIAIGNPLGSSFAGSVTAGIISGLNRNLQSDYGPVKLIQTDAAINPGNSGGPLVNSKAEVIGITSVKLTSLGSSIQDPFGMFQSQGTPIEGMGFAIPINEAKPIIDQIIKYGYVERPMMGIGAQTITEQDAQRYNLPVGVYVVQVQPNSGAEQAGIQPGDVIIKVDGKDITSFEDLQGILDDHKVGDVIKVTIWRNGRTFTVNVKLQSSANFQ